MMKELVLILIIVHVICDFYLQTKKTDLRRQTELKWVVYHSVIYGVSAGLLFLIFLPGLNVTFIIAFILSHGIIDILKYMCKFPSVFLQKLEQYSAVGLVLTAKSIARYDRITKEQNFAEHYLLGTLLSTIVAVCVSIVFQQV